MHVTSPVHVSDWKLITLVLRY